MEDLKMILKGIGIWQKITPTYVPYLILDSIFTCLKPYFPLYMSAEIVNELVGTCDLRRLLILADGGGSNKARGYLWKEAVQQIADTTGLEIYVSHYPPGTSKYNPIERKLW